MSTASRGNLSDEFPEPSVTIFDRDRSTREIRPYVHPDTGRAPQEEFLAGPEGAGATDGAGGAERTQLDDVSAIVLHDAVRQVVLVVAHGDHCDRHGRIVCNRLSCMTQCCIACEYQ